MERFSQTLNLFFSHRWTVRNKQRDKQELQHTINTTYLTHLYLDLVFGWMTKSFKVWKCTIYLLCHLWCPSFFFFNLLSQREGRIPAAVALAQVYHSLNEPTKINFFLHTRVIAQESKANGILIANSRVYSSNRW